MICWARLSMNVDILCEMHLHTFVKHFRCLNVCTIGCINMVWLIREIIIGKMKTKSLLQILIISKDKSNCWLISYWITKTLPHRPKNPMPPVKLKKSHHFRTKLLQNRPRPNSKPLVPLIFPTKTWSKVKWVLKESKERETYLHTFAK